MSTVPMSYFSWSLAFLSALCWLCGRAYGRREERIKIMDEVNAAIFHNALQPAKEAAKPYDHTTGYATGKVD